MKKICFLIGFCLMMLTGNAQLPLSEPFDYTPHATFGLSIQSGAWLTINTGDSILLTAGSLTYPGLAASSGNKVKYDGSGTDYYRDFGSQTSGSVYSSFILNISSLGTLGTTGGYFAGVIQAGSTSLFGAAVWSRLSTTAGKFNIGISTRSNSAVTWLSNELDPGTSYFIVTAYDMIAGTGNDVARIWLNTSAIGASEPSANATAVAGTDLTSVARVFLRQDNATNTPFIELDELRIGATWTSVTPGGAPSANISATALTSFNSVCINTTGGPNSFTITGTNLSAANVDVAALTGFTYSTTSGGTYTTTLSLSQAGGPYSQQIFVKFDPTLVQSYNGNIVLSGGGATSINVAASGSGINTMPTVNSGSASAVTQISATVAGTISANGCSVISAYGIEWSTTSAFANGSGTAVASTNIAGGNFSSDLSGLSSGTTYYYHAYATNSAGTSYGPELSFTTLSPNPFISTTSLTAFGNVCISTIAGPNSFTINGTNLSTVDLNVGPLTGFVFSTTVGGTYTSSLIIPQPGGTYTQSIYVQFMPTLVQSYNGNIVVNGGGISAAVNVAASGAGVNSTPTVVTGGSSSITTTTVTLAGSFTLQGCTPVTAYGIEYSTTNGFANGSGTQVASTNNTSGNFTSALSLLTPSTTYYYKAYATNAGGTSYGAQQSFTTAAPPPPSLNATALTGFGSVCIGTTAGPNSFTLNGTNLTTLPITVGPLAGFAFSETAGGVYSNIISVIHTGGTLTRTVYVKFSPTAVQSYNGNIPITGGGTTGTLNLVATGAGVNTPPSVTTGSATNLFTHHVTLAGSLTANGCLNPTSYGIEISGINGFADGTGTKFPSSNIVGGAFSVTLNDLVQGATYYYKAYGTNGGGTGYGAQQSFTMVVVPDVFTIFPVPAAPGTEMRFSMKNIAPGNYSLLFYNSQGALVLQHNMNIQANFINQTVTIPGTMARGIYQVHLMNVDGTIAKKSILVH